MTTPMQMDINDSVSTMSIIMPFAYTKENLPIPNDPNVRIKNTADEYIAVRRFGGYASDKDLKFYPGKTTKSSERKWYYLNRKLYISGI